MCVKGCWAEHQMIFHHLLAGFNNKKQTKCLQQKAETFLWKEKEGCGLVFSDRVRALSFLSHLCRSERQEEAEICSWQTEDNLLLLLAHLHCLTTITVLFLFKESELHHQTQCDQQLLDPVWGPQRGSQTDVKRLVLFSFWFTVNPLRAEMPVQIPDDSDFSSFKDQCLSSEDWISRYSKGGVTVWCREEESKSVQKLKVSVHTPTVIKAGSSEASQPALRSVTGNPPWTLMEFIQLAQWSSRDQSLFVCLFPGSPINISHSKTLIINKLLSGCYNIIYMIIYGVYIAHSTLYILYIRRVTH